MNSLKVSISEYDTFFCAAQWLIKKEDGDQVNKRAPFEVLLVSNQIHCTILY